MTAVLAHLAGASPRGPVTALSVIFGLFIGSFLNVVIYRVPRGLSVVQPRSFCPGCHTPIRPADNIPVLSWLVLRGRCRRCGTSISVRYPAVELATGLLFGATAWALGGRWGVPGMCALAATVLVLVLVVSEGSPPPASIALVGSGVGVALLSAAAVADRAVVAPGRDAHRCRRRAVHRGRSRPRVPVARATCHGRAGPLPLGPVVLRGRCSPPGPCSAGSARRDRWWARRSPSSSPSSWPRSCAGHSGADVRSVPWR